MRAIESPLIKIMVCRQIDTRDNAAMTRMQRIRQRAIKRPGRYIQKSHAGFKMLEHENVEIHPNLARRL